jgi:uncharacterized protein (TIGR03067 family)
VPGLAALLVIGLAVGVSPARAALAGLPEGTWVVAQATLNGQYRAERKILNSTWTFRGDELLLQPADGVPARWALTFDATAEPPAFLATPLDAPGEHPVWMISSRQGDELRLAFYDGRQGRPEDFGPRRKLVVLTLVPAAATPPRVPDPCDMLRAAGADRLLGGPTRPRQEPAHASSPGATCALERLDGSGTVTLTLVAPPAGAAYVNAMRRDLASRRGVQVEEESALGPGAYSAIRGWTVFTIALKHGTAMLLGFEAPTVARAELRRFAQHVNDQL